MSEDWLKADGRRRARPDKGSWNKYEQTISLPGCSEKTPLVPSLDWLELSTRYLCWKKEHPGEFPLVVSIEAVKGVAATTIYEFDGRMKKYRYLDHLPRGNEVIVVVIDRSTLIGEAEDHILKQLNRLAGGGFFAVRIETASKGQALECRERLRGLADRAPITQEKITQSNEASKNTVVMVGRKWRDRKEH